MFEYFDEKIDEIFKLNKHQDQEDSTIIEIFTTFFKTVDEEDFIESLTLIYEEDIKLKLSTDQIELSSDEEHPKSKHPSSKAKSKKKIV